MYLPARKTNFETTPVPAKPTGDVPSRSSCQEARAMIAAVREKLQSNATDEDAVRSPGGRHSSLKLS